MDFNKLSKECFKVNHYGGPINFKLSELEVYGNLLDAGSKDVSTSYYRYLDLSVKSKTFDYIQIKMKRFWKLIWKNSN